MAVAIREYLKYFGQKEYPALFDEESLRRLANVEMAFGSLETEESILEVCLSKEARSCDYSIRVDMDSPFLKEYWYELDSDACSSREIAPCYFVDASKVVPGADNSAFYDKVLVRLAGQERVDRLRQKLEYCVEKLQGRCDCLFQLGAMTGRLEMDSIRLFTENLSRKDLTAYLQDIGWKGDVAALDSFLAEWECYSDRKKFILDFDVFADGISEKIGINFGTVNKKPATVETFLNALENAGLCLQSKKEDIVRFISAFPCHTPFIQNDISHFKIPFRGSGALMAKAYLRQGSVCYYRGFQAYDTPVLMNLELTTRCPLRCPQCYCDLVGGKDMKLDTALFWIAEAARSNVRTVNLSGGETMVYPHLLQLISACHEQGMKANVALSGYGVDRHILEEMIAYGVSEICISLNGSTEQVNSHSRDGYQLAIRALTLLAEMGYPKTCINWVMHSSNADDFEEMLKLAERYHVGSLAVMMFKPDASNQLPSVPTGEQVHKVAKLIKSYQGNIQIEVEACFSQMRAVLGKRFLTNLNQGISRGCGAGRDGISISVDGRITPCRHLELEEDADSIRDYWEHSQVLKQLREADDKPEEPCSGCCYRRYCLPCMAVNWKMKGRIFMGDESCPIRP